ncbi:MAG: DNA polymerase III subunit delta [Pseudomonadales bacterium]|nr:DNA polymerase III subunit delta [Pseudomonadales bacterium]
MKVYADKLKAELSRRIAPVYIVSGDEPLLVQEVADEIRATLRAQGFSERDLFHAERGFDWEEVLFSANSMSLFAEQKILEIRLPGGKPGDKGAAALASYAEALSEGTVMLLILPRLDARSQSAAWFKALEGIGVFVQVWPIDIGEMPRWVTARMRRAGLSATPEAVGALVDRVEGNLLAAIQEIERLALVAVNGKVGIEEVVEGVSDSSRYDVFGLIDAALSQDASRTVKICEGLRLEGVELLPTISLVAREIRNLSQMARAVENGKSPDAAMQQYKIWAKRKGPVGKCLRRHKSGDFLSYARRLSAVDRAVKGMGHEEPWVLFTDVMVALAGRTAIEDRVDRLLP